MTVRTTLRVLTLAAAAATIVVFAQQTPRNVDGTSDKMWGDAAKSTGARGAWMKESRFAMFIHWGLYSELGGRWQDRNYYGISEWIMNRARIPAAEYEKVAGRFNPTGFDARDWARTAKAAGMRTIMITAKHHDGFAMFGSKASRYNIVDATPFHRDVMKELAAACREAGLIFCLYYSVPDWNYPDFPSQYSQTGMKWNPNAFHGSPKPDADIKKYAAYMKGQLKELLTQYGPVGIIWFDGGGSFKGVNRGELLGGKDIITLIHQLQPGCLINNRLDGNLGDYGTPEQKIPGAKQTAAFEVCMTLNKHWGYNKFDQHWKPAREVICKLADIASKGGNFLLNVGPTASGEFPSDAVRILGEVGKWTAVNGEGIYRATASPFDKAPSWGRVTAGPGKLYLHVLNWPTDGKLILACSAKPTQAWLLADRTACDVKQDAGSITISVPAKAPDRYDSVIVLGIPGS